jgi:hypothetical protein
MDLLEQIEEATGHKSAIDFYIFLRTTGTHTGDFAKVTRPQRSHLVFGKWVTIEERIFTIDMRQVREAALEELVERLPARGDIHKIFQILGVPVATYQVYEAREILDKLPKI